MRTGLVKDDAGKVDSEDPRKSCKHMYELGLHSEARGSHRRVLNRAITRSDFALERSLRPQCGR